MEKTYFTYGVSYTISHKSSFLNLSFLQPKAYLPALFVTLDGCASFTHPFPSYQHVLNTWEKADENSPSYMTRLHDDSHRKAYFW